MIKVLVVDDSNFMRSIISYILRSDKSIEVVGTAGDGIEAVDRVKDLNPDVITMDINMPRMDGLAAVKEIMRQFPTPIIILSAYSKKEARVTFQTLEYGAVDFIEKPYGEVSANLESIRTRLIEKIKVAAISRVRSQRSEVRNYNPELPACAANAHLSRNGGQGAAGRRIPNSQLVKVVVIGSSTGGPGVVSKILSDIPLDIPLKIVVVQHMPRAFTAAFAERLNETSPFEVKEAGEGDYLKRGRALVAPGGFHTYLTSSGRIKLSPAKDDSGFTPSVDITMSEAARIYGDVTIGVILSGIGTDGTLGLKSVKNAGGITIAQDEASCMVFGMPKSAIEYGVVDRVVPSLMIGREIVGILAMGTGLGIDNFS